MAVVVFTPAEDTQSGSLVRAMRARGLRVGVFDLSDPSRNRLTLRFEAGRASGAISTADGARFDLDEVRAFVGHFFSTRAPPGIEPSARQFATEEWFASLVALHQATRERCWVNPLDAWVLGDSKPFQLQCASRAGLATPATLVTNEAGEIEALAKASPDGLAVKRVSHPFPRLGEPTPPEWVLYTHRVRPEELTGDALREAHVAPLGLQAYVEKRTEVRAYVVGARVLACEILSQEEEGTKVDWRRYPRRADGEIDTERWRCRPYALPADVAEKLRAAASAMGLRYAAIDLIVTPAGEHVFLEANVMGAFGFAESLAGLPISEAFAELAANAAAPRQ